MQKRGEMVLVMVISVATRKQIEFIDVTPQVRELVRKSGCTDGVCLLYVPHTTAGLLINENADPDVVRDIAEALERLAPVTGNYFHREGNAHAHIKASILGCSQTIFIRNGDLALGTWQGIFFCEFDGPRKRSLYVKIMQENEKK